MRPPQEAQTLRSSPVGTLALAGLSFRDTVHDDVRAIKA